MWENFDLNAIVKTDDQGGHMQPFEGERNQTRFNTVILNCYVLLGVTVGGLSRLRILIIVIKLLLFQLRNSSCLNFMAQWSLKKNFH